MAAPKEILELVERFQRNRETYEDPHFNETETRIQFLNPLFKALGWDVDNAAGYAEAYKDVIHEAAVKIGGATKAPDYCFTIGGARKFFLEAKKPAVNVKDDANPAYQLRRYAWSAKLPVSILSNFAELAVYDCRARPDKNDKASKGRIQYWDCGQYAKKWDEIASIFSKDAILKGSFDKFAASSRNKRGTAEVDDEFLNEIEEWRELFAKNIALRNPKITQRELNFAVQQTIDRVIFLRICEDRGIEPYGRLQSLQNGENIYERLKTLFHQADDRYNSGLFHFREETGRRTPPDQLTPSLKIDDKPLKDIFKRLYYPDSPYEFSVLSADILGQVYEQFLGKVIRLTAAGHAKVEDKPEVKKAGGVYYTPTYIVDYIVKQTVGKLLEGKTTKDLKRLTVLDPACGSGSFLLGAFQYLLDWYLKQYAGESAETHAKGRRPKIFKTEKSGWRLTTAERKRILLEHIYGVDIDPQAVEVTKLSLLLKVLEEESAENLNKSWEFFHERALPDLDNNIKCGNSLIASDYFKGRLDFNENEQFLVNPFDWNEEFSDVFQSGGFDAVIGNPPYDVLEKDRGESSWPHSALVEYVRLRPDYQPALGGKLNLFRFFVVRSLNLTRDGGKFGMIVPLSILADISTANTRKHVLAVSNNLTADCFPQKDNATRRVFFKAKLSTVILTCSASRKSNPDPQIEVRVYPWNSFEDKPKKSEIRLVDVQLLDPDNTPIPLVGAREWQLCKKIHKLQDVCRLAEIKDYQVTRGEINQTIFRVYINDDSKLTRLLKGVEVARYAVNEELSQGTREWFDEARFLKANSPKPVAHQKRIATQRITGVDERQRIVATVIEPKTYFADSTNSVALSNGASYSLDYLLALLNSRLFQWRFKVTSTNNNVGTNELCSLPFRRIDVSDEKERTVYEALISKAENLRALNIKIHQKKFGRDREVLLRKIEATDRQVDALVYKLYGLTDDEIKVVEGAA